MTRYRFLVDKNYLIIFILSLFICVFNINGFPIYILDEAKNAEAAREMLINNTLVVPTFNGNLRTDKPPLHYFFMMMGYKLFGVNALGARFFSSLFGAFTLLGTYYFINKHSNLKIAFLSWVVLISAVFFVQLFHQAVPDPYLVFCISMGLFCFFTFYKNKINLYLLLFYVFLGLGMLSKGPVSIVLPVFIVLVFLFIKDELFSKKIFSYRPFLGLFIITAIVIPWYYAVHIQTDGLWTKGFFLEHNFNRFNNKMEGHGGIFLITWAYVILGLLPFSVFIFQSLRLAFKNKSEELSLFSLITVLVFIIFFSISSTKLPNYTIPCYPFMAYLIAKYLISLIRFQDGLKWYKWSLITLGVISIALPIGVYFVFYIESQLFTLRWYSLFLIVAPVGWLAGLFYLKKKKVFISILSIGVTWVCLSLVIFGFIYPKLLQQNPVSKSFEIIPETENIIAYKSFDAAFPFNYKSTFRVLKYKENLLKEIESNDTLYIISNKRNVKEELEELNLELLFEMKALFENHKTLIYRSITN